MANEYLQRTPTSTGNRRVFTWSGWVKLNRPSYPSAGNYTIFCAGTNGSNNVSALEYGSNNNFRFYDYGGSYTFEYYTTQKFRDSSSWMHILASVDTTKSTGAERVDLYINGTKLTSYSTETDPTINAQCAHFNNTSPHYLGKLANQESYPAHEYTDVFLVDGQALTPDIFGFYKQGKGYISAGSTQATDFRPGQWVPKTPRVIKTEINRRGGFGVNGFYLPMNDSRNFGADFHCDPNSIITLNEKLPQPRVGVATTASVGLGYTDALRADPYAANLVLALPFVSGGLSSGFGDYAPSIKGSGSAKSITVSGNTTITNVGTAETASVFYGSGAKFDGVDDYITIPNSSDFSFGSGDFTVECWANFGNFSGATSLVNVFENATARRSWSMEGRSSGAFRFEWWYDGSTSQSIDASTNTLSTGQWNHFAMVRKGPTITGYINGVAVGIKTDVGSQSLYNNTTDPLVIGALFTSGTPVQDFSGYIQDLRVYKGVAKYTGGFDVPRPYTPVGIATWRAVPDTTANNFATLNPLAERQAQKGTISAGNLRYDGTLNQQPEITSTVGVSTGKWYYEVYTGTKGDGGDSHFIGICNRSANSNGTTITIPTSNVSGTRPTVGISNRFSTQLALYDQDNFYDISGTSGWWADGSVVGFAFDINNNSVSVYKNGVLGFTSTVSLSYVATGIGTTIGQGAWSPWLSLESSSSRTPASNWVMNFGQNPTFSGNTTSGTFTDSNGKGLFKYQPPSGFLALCEDNLPTPAISDPGKYFKTVLYTGTGTVNAIKGVGFQPDFVWGKRRNNTGNLWIFDSVRGATNQIVTNSTNAEVPGSTEFISFDSDGFTVTSTAGSFNNSGDSYVAWCWRAGAGTTSTNTSGSITSVVSVNQDAGFSIVSYRSNGTSGATVGHSLARTPSFIIVKMRSSQAVGTADWAVYHKSLGATKNIWLNAANVANTSSTYWNNTEPTSSVFSLGNDLDTNHTNGYDYIAYCWAEIEGFSKFGSFIGNGNADGPMVYCGFKPALILTKVNNAGYNWTIYDCSRSSYNPNTYVLFPNLSNAESQSLDHFDWLSNGFKIRGTSINPSGTEVFFAAFAESPFTTANAK